MASEGTDDTLETVAHREQSQFGNAAAWQSDPPRNGAAPAIQLKTDDAATLAQSLATGSSWADRVFPSNRSSTVRLSSEPPHMGRLRSPDTIDTPRPIQQREPPPAYSEARAVEEPEMPADVPDRTLDDRRDEGPGPSIYNRPSSSYFPPQDPDHTERSPLLEPTSHQDDDLNQAQTKRSRKSKIALWVVAAVIIICFALLGFLLATEWDHGDTSVEGPEPPNRRYEQHEKHNNITGTFQLYDLLDLSTSTGNIDIEIDPMPGKEPAVLQVKSKAGSIRIQLSSSFRASSTTLDAVERQFETSIDAEFGHVKAELLIGNGGSTNVSTKAGTIDLKLLAIRVGPFDGITRISTVSTLADQNVTIKSVRGASPVTNIRAEHWSTGVGSLDIRYPPEWMGKVYAVAAGLGDVRVSGDNLTFVTKNNWEMLAYRGSSPPEENTVEVKSAVTGSAWFSC